MPNTVVGLYRTEIEIRSVVDDLVRHDFPRQGISLHEEGGARLRDWLVEQGVPEGEADDYVEGVRAGGKLVTLEATDARTRDALEIMRRHEARNAAGATGVGASGAAWTGVEVEGADPARGGYVFDDDREHFRTHHREAFANSEHGYEDVEPAYRFGTDLATHPDYADHDWNTLSASARDRWERQNAGSWNDVEPAVRYGWERARARRR